MVNRIAHVVWRCAGCNYRYFQWSFDGRPGIVYLNCARCGRASANRDEYVMQGRALVVVLAAWAAVAAARRIFPSRLEDASARDYALAAGLLVAGATLAYRLLLRRLSLCPDFLADPKQDRRQRPPQLWNRVVPVKSLEEEYRFIQFHPFRCACGIHTPRKVEGHGVLIRPAWLGRLLGGNLLPVFRLQDAVEVRCRVCHGRHSYLFDIAALPHIHRGFRRRFVQNPSSLLFNHMALVSRFHEHAQRTGGFALEF
jgi:hypothetical protein